MDNDWHESTGDYWKPKKDGDSVSGLLINKQSNVGSNNSNLYFVEDRKEHMVYKVWGSTILDDRMAPVRIGQEVRITFKGLGEASKGKNPPKIFKVEYRDFDLNAAVDNSFEEAQRQL